MGVALGPQFQSRDAIPEVTEVAEETIGGTTTSAVESKSHALVVVSATVNV